MVLARAEEEANKRLSILRENHKQNFLKDLYSAKLPLVAKTTKTGPANSKTASLAKHQLLTPIDNKENNQKGTSSLKQYQHSTRHAKGANKENVPFSTEFKIDTNNKNH